MEVDDPYKGLTKNQKKALKKKLKNKGKQLYIKTPLNLHFAY